MNNSILSFKIKLLFPLIGFFFLFLVFNHGSIAQNVISKEQKIAVLDKEKSYPKIEKDVMKNDTIILLETKKDFFLDEGAHIYYVSANRILIANNVKGDVFIFDANGKALSRFNQRGGLGYAFLSYVLYDEKNKEIYILDEISKKIYIFTEEGELKRSFRFPPGTTIAEIYNFNDNEILAYHEYKYGEVTQNKPYIFISKKDGKILSRLNIYTNKANARELRTENSIYKIKTNFSGNCKFGQDFILANMSSDTIYLLKQDKTLKPIFVQCPSVFSNPPIITSVGMYSDNFLIFCIYTYNLKELRKQYENDATRDPINSRTRFLLYELKSNKFYELERQKYWAEKIDLPKNMSVEMTEPYVLKEWLKRGYLSGKLKKIASKIEIDANPIVVLTKFK